MSRSDNLLVLSWMETYLDQLYDILKRLQAHPDNEPSKLVMKLIQDFQNDLLDRSYTLYGLRPVNETLCDGPNNNEDDIPY